MHCLTLQMNKIKEVVNLVHVMHERHPANYSTMFEFTDGQSCAVYKLLHPKL